MKHLFQKSFFILSIPLLFFPLLLQAQLAAWQYKDAISVLEQSGIAKTNYQVLVTLNTKALITAGKMKSDGSDIRFAKNCDGTVLYNYYIESGINTENTPIWVKVPSLPAGASVTFYLFYGNSAATAVSNFTTTFPTSRVVTGTTLITSDTLAWNYDWIEIAAGGSLMFDPLFSGTFTMNARRILINGTLNGDGAGFTGTATGSGNGPGGGAAASTTGGGGAGHGGEGGYGAYCCSSPNYGGAGGIAYDAGAMTIQPGSGGGPPGLVGSGTSGGNGGVALILNAASVSISAAVSANGLVGGSSEYCAGGGSGGGILIKASHVTLTNTASLSVKGGAGGSSVGGVYYGGGGGAGGRIKILYQAAYLNQATITLTGGLAGTGGSPPGIKGNNGTFSAMQTYEVKEPVVTISEGLNPVAGIFSDKTVICQSVPVKFTAVPGNGGANPVYQWQLNGQDIAGAASNVYSSSALNNQDKICYRMVSNSVCLNMQDTAFSDTITVTVYPQVLVPSFTSNPDTVGVVDQEIQFSATTDGATDWYWDFGDWNYATVKDPTHAYSDSGWYEVRLYAGNMCTMDSAKKWIRVDSAGVVAVPFSKEPAFRLYPNPSNGVCYLEFRESPAADLTIRMEDISGRILSSAWRSTGERTGKIDLSDYPKGVYLVKVQSGTEWLVRKLMVY